MEPLYVMTQVLAVDDKRVHLFHACIGAGTTLWSPQANRCICMFDTRLERPRRWTPRYVRSSSVARRARLAAGAGAGAPARRHAARLSEHMPKIVDHEQRRDEIALVACRVVAEHGFDQATIVRIAREAGYTTGMVAHYFDTKQEIMIAALRLILRVSKERLTRARGGRRAGSAGGPDRGAADRRAALYRMRVLDRLLGPGVGRQELQAHQRLAASRVHAAVQALRRAGLAGVDSNGRRRFANRYCARS